MRLQLIGCFTTAAICLIAIIDRSTSTSPPSTLVGLALAYVGPLASHMSGVLSSFTETEKLFVSAERVQKYSYLPSESSRESTPYEARTVPASPPPENWPQRGAIDFADVVMSYSGNETYALQHVTFHINPNERVAVIGRTGAGKSSLFAALLGLYPLSRGAVSIDGVDLQGVAVDDVRSRIAVLPQDVFAFHGSIRSNVDPFHQHTDEAVHDALLSVGISPLLSHLEEEGKNLSTGERHLVAVARTLLLKSHVLLIDELAAGMDDETYQRVRSAISTAFGSCTVIEITHRGDLSLYDIAICLDKGRVVYCGPPQGCPHHSSE